MQGASVLQRASPRKRPPHRAFDIPLRASQRTRSTGSGPACRQVFGLMDTDRMIHLTFCFPGFRPVQCESSFPLTAAGQLRIHTGFPFNPTSCDAGRRRGRHRRSTSYCVRRRASTPYLVSGGPQAGSSIGSARWSPGRDQARRRSCSSGSASGAGSLSAAARASSSSIAASTASTVVGPPPNRRIAVRPTWRVSYQA